MKRYQAHADIWVPARRGQAQRIEQSYDLCVIAENKLKAKAQVFRAISFWPGFFKCHIALTEV